MNQFPTRRNRHQELLIRLAAKIYSWRGATESSVRPDNALIIVCVSDTHNTTPPLPHGDLLLHAGDLTERGTFTELQAQLTWLNAQPHTHKVVIAGNHDLMLDPAIGKRSDESPTKLDWGSIIYLQDRSVTLDFPNGRVLTVYAAPWTPKFGNWALPAPSQIGRVDQHHSGTCRHPADSWAASMSSGHEHVRWSHGMPTSPPWTIPCPTALGRVRAYSRELRARDRGVRSLAEGLGGASPRERRVAGFVPLGVVDLGWESAGNCPDALLQPDADHTSGQCGCSGRARE